MGAQHKVIACPKTFGIFLMLRRLPVSLPARPQLWNPSDNAGGAACVQERQSEHKEERFMKKIPALLVAAVLGCGTCAFAADTSYDSASSHAKATAHQVASDLKGALHKIGSATKRGILRADAALQRVVHRGTSGNA
jgi:hypothetical protein